MSVYRVYVEKKAPFAVEAQGVLSDIRSSLGIHSASCVRILNRYDVEDISKEDFELAKGTIFSEPQVDDVYDELPSFAAEDRVFAVQFLPGQFDQRADSAVQCIQLATQHERPTVASAKVYVISGVSDEELARIKAHLINPVESMEASLELPKTLHTPFDVPADVAVLEGFCELDQQGLQEFIDQYGLAMDLGDITFCQKYFKETEKRTPTITEIRMIDTYWSDHCRHTTFSTNIEQVDIESDYVKDAYNEYLELRKTLHAGKNKPMTLMDLATIGAKALKKKGLLSALDESEEINACSVKIKVDMPLLADLRRNFPADADIRMDIPENLVVWGDKGCIRRAVSNALRNAVTYAGSKGPIRVRTGFRPVDNAVLLRVVDSGDGVPEAELPSLTEPFFRGAEAQRKHPGGSGLGLAIIRNSIEQCGGSVFCANEKPRGFSVTMIFPCGQRGE